MIVVSYHDRVNVLQAKPLVSASPFDRAQWFALLSEDAGLSPIIAMAEDGDEAVALPLMQDGNRLIPLANWYSFLWRPLKTEGAALPEMVESLARDLKQKTHRVTFSTLPAEDGTVEVLARCFHNAGWAVIREQCDTNHFLSVSGRSYADYLASRPGRLRTTLKRKAKKLDVSIHKSFTDQAWRDYEEIYQQSWKPAEGNPAMLRHFAEQEGAAGRLRLAIACHEGRAIAAQLWTVESGTAWIHKLAHIEDATHLSAGTVLTAALMERVIDTDGVEIVDFGTGDDGYKGTWMDGTRRRWRLDCHPKYRPKTWLYLARSWLRELASRPDAG